MSVLKADDKVHVKAGAYNIADHRWGRRATVTRVDTESKLLPIRIEYPDSTFNWTNEESLDLIGAAPSQHAAIGKDILDRMEELKASIIARDNAVKLVVDQTEALDALLASVGLKRGEEIPLVPVRVTATSRTALDDVADKSIRTGLRYRCTSDDMEYFTMGSVYVVEELDQCDNLQPVAFRDNDGDEFYPERHELTSFVRVI